MNEKTEELREVFLEVTDEETVTEHQEEQRGSIAIYEDEIGERLRSTIEAMTDHYGRQFDLPRDDLVEIVRLFYSGHDDAEIAPELVEDASDDDVARARIDLHLVTEADREGPLAPEELRERLDAGSSIGEIAAEHDVGESVVERGRRVIEIEEERRLIGDRFRQEFERILGDRALSNRLTEGVTEDGLDDATEGIETNVSF